MDVFQEARREREDFDDLMAECDIAKLNVKNEQEANGTSAEPKTKHYFPELVDTTTTNPGQSATPKSLDAEKEKTGVENESIEQDANGFVYYKCRFCGLTFNYMNTLRAHERVHNVSQPYVCGKCGDAFEFACQLEYHVQQHSDVDGYKCECGRTFFSYTEMLYHKHDDEVKELFGAPEVTTVPSTGVSSGMVFDLPQPSFATDGYEPKHPMKVYSDVRSKPYICEYCSKSYSDSRGLAYHMYSHRGEKQFNPRASRYMIGREGVGYSDSKSYYLFPRTSGYTPRF